MSHPQQPTPIQVDNSTAVGIANKSIKQKRSKAMDMRFCLMLLSYGARVKFAETEDDTPLLPEERLKFIQQVVGVF